MAKTRDISFSPLRSFSEARATTEPACRVLQFAGGDRVEPRPPLWPTPSFELDVAGWHDASRPSETTADVHVHFVRDVLVGGFGSHLFVEGEILVNDDCYPHYLGKFIKAEISRWNWEIEDKIDAKSTMRLDSAFVISHFNPIYGHWLLEIFPKLFAIRDLMRRGVSAPILLPSGYCIPAFLKETVRQILPRCRIVEYDWLTHNVQVGRAILPGMMHRDYVFNRAFHKAIRRFTWRSRWAPGPSGLFVSRTGVADKFRQLENGAALDQLAAELGLAVVRPETLPWARQVQLFASARLIVGEFGSGMHNAIFSAPGTKVVCLNVINEVQSKIANSFGHDIGYILDPDHKPRLLKLHWKEQQTYRVDTSEFRRRILPLL